MSTVKKYQLSQRQYIQIEDGSQKSFGGNQDWFPKGYIHIKNHLMHQHGCGVIALADLFLYWAMTLPNGKETLAAQYFDERNHITKEKYMAFAEEVRRQYAFIFGTAGTFTFELSLAINRYAKNNHIHHMAKLDMSLNNISMLKQMQDMLTNNQPIILCIGYSEPILLSRLHKRGIPFYKQTKVTSPINKRNSNPYAKYEVAHKCVYGHFVMVTGIIIDDNAQRAKEHIMLRISSWGREYYISYHELRHFISEVSSPYLSSMISIS